MVNRNITIAQFMGFDIGKKVEYVPSEYPACMRNSEHLIVSNEDNLPFHTDWRWLMEVVDKIVKTPAPIWEHYVDDYSIKTFGFKDGEFMFRFNGFGLHKASTMIDAVYSAVNEFVNATKYSVFDHDTGDYLFSGRNSATKEDCFMAYLQYRQNDLGEWWRDNEIIAPKFHSLYHDLSDDLVDKKANYLWEEWVKEVVLHPDFVLQDMACCNFSLSEHHGIS